MTQHAESTNFHQAIHVAVLSSIGIVALPVAVLSILILLKDWNAVYIVKRRRSIVVCTFAIFCFFSFVYMPWSTTRRMMLLEETTTYGFTITTIARFLCYPISFSTPLMLFLRVWLYYYDTFFYQFQKERNWRLVIDPIKESNNWFIENRNFLGNESLLLRAVLVIGTVNAWVYLLCSLFSPVMGTVVMAFNFILVVVIATFLAFKFQATSIKCTVDLLCIRKEICIISILSLVGIASQLLPLVLGKFGVSYETNEAIEEISSAFFYHSMLFTVVIVPKLYFSAANSSTHLSKESLTSSSNGKVWYTWDAFVATYRGYQAFMAHLEGEMSFENLLFCHEYAQVRSVLHEYFSGILNDLRVKYSYRPFELNLPAAVAPTGTDGKRVLKKSKSEHVCTSSCIPESFISQQLRNSLIKARNENNSNIQICEAIITAFELIYKKYVAEYGAILLINISGGQRQLLTDLFITEENKNTRWERNRSIDNSLRSQVHALSSSGKGNTGDLIAFAIEKCVVTMEPSVRDVSGLLHSAFSRFRKTDEYKDIAVAISP